MDSGGMDLHWVHPKEDDQEVLERALKNLREYVRKRKQREERYRNGDYS